LRQKRACWEIMRLKSGVAGHKACDIYHLPKTKKENELVESQEKGKGGR